MDKNQFRINLRIAAIGLLSILVGAMMFNCGGRKQKYTSHDLVENYTLRSNQIIELDNYFNGLVPQGMMVGIEFKNDNTLGFFNINENETYSNNFNIKIDSPLVDTLLQRLGWTRETLQTLRDNLDKANCISIRNGNPCNVGFRRIESGEYFYNLFDEPIATNLQSNYNDSCVYVLLNDRVVLEYVNGIVGAPCFPDFRK